MRAFVTGGSGFAGRSLLAGLRAAGWSVIALERSERARQIVAAHGATPYRGDLFDPIGLRAGMRAADVVLHVAGSVETRDPAEVWRLNVDGTRHALDAARSAGVPRFIHYGASAVVMGGPKPMLGVTEAAPIDAPPWSPFIRSKAEAERQVLAANEPGFTSISLRPASLWGPGSFLLAELATQVQAGRFVWIEHGRYPVSTCHVENLTQAARLAAQGNGAGGEAYFVTDDGPIEYRRFISEQLALAGLDPGDRSVPRWLAWGVVSALELAATLVGRRPPVTRELLRLGGQPFTLDSSKARLELGYAPGLSREEGLDAVAADLGTNRT
jgi:nucleoside-diphosphate-sugar epimerase